MEGREELLNSIRLNRSVLLFVFLLLLLIHIYSIRTPLRHHANRVFSTISTQSTFLSDPDYRILLNEKEDLLKSGSQVYYMCNYDVDPYFSMNLFYYDYTYTPDHFFTDGEIERLSRRTKQGDVIVACSESTALSGLEFTKSEVSHFYLYQIEK